ncbi:type VII secretion protein EccE [Streptomyces lonarensis]|uniref:type VII secretion protein EccE n=1 Tax=Streptomyces lonarensis TaxID=700599 RepID=UPI0030C70FD7
MSERRAAGTAGTAGTPAAAGERPAAVRRRPGIGRLVAAQGAVGVTAAGVALANPAGWALAGAGALALLPVLARRNGRWLDESLAHRLPRLHRLHRLHRGGADGPAARATGHRPTAAGEVPGREDLGLVHRLLPALDVVAVADRNGPELGMVADGRGSAALLELPGGVLPSLPVGLLAQWLREDPAGPAGAQLLVEQFGLPPWDVLYRYRPTLAYRQLPGRGAPTAVRSWLVVRHEPLDAPEAVARRGGGARGAGAALAAATARLRSRLAAAGVAATPLGPERTRAVLRQTGDADGGGGTGPGCWAGAATHCVATAQVAGPEDWDRLLHGLGRTPADRILVGAAVEVRDGVPRVRTVVRLVGAVGEQIAAERDRLVAAGAVGPSPADPRAGVLATLPLAAPGHAAAAVARSALTGRR